MYTCTIYFYKGMKKTAAMFDAWNELKKKLEFGKSRKKDAKVWEIWWYWEWVNIGSEISKDSKFIRYDQNLELKGMIDFSYKNQNQIYKYSTNHTGKKTFEEFSYSKNGNNMKFPIQKSIYS